MVGLLPDLELISLPESDPELMIELVLGIVPKSVMELLGVRMVVLLLELFTARLLFGSVNR